MAQQVSDLEADDQRTLQRIRERLATDGMELTPDETLEVIRSSHETLMTLLDANDLDHIRRIMMRVNWQDAPPPPYVCEFDDLSEIEDLKRRSEAKYKVPLIVVPTGHKRWRLLCQTSAAKSA